MLIFYKLSDKQNHSLPCNYAKQSANNNRIEWNTNAYKATSNSSDIIVSKQTCKSTSAKPPSTFHHYAFDTNNAAFQFQDSPSKGLY